jgi:hypothetical protein
VLHDQEAVVVLLLDGHELEDGKGAAHNPQESHVLRALPGRVLSALELLCIMYAGFKRIEPGMDIGVELGEEWGMAERLADDIV